MNGLESLWNNVRNAPRSVWDSLFRHGLPLTDRTRSETVFHNLFLHVHPVRVHRWTLKPTFTFGLGMVALSCYGILIVTGLLLMFYYKPSTALAYDSIKDIHYVVPTGRIMRNVHRWAAHLMVLSVILHMARVFFTASYKRTRQFNWVVGILLLVVTFGLSFTGYLLPWDQLAYWAVTIGANIAQSPRELTDALNLTQYMDPGGLMKLLILGSNSVGEDALIRFNLFHVILLPIVLTVLLGVHFWRIRKDGGLSRPEELEIDLQPLEGEEHRPVFTQTSEKTYGIMAFVKGSSPAVGRSPENTVPSWPHLFLAELAVFMGTLVVLLAWALLMDAPLKELANPLVPENPAKAPWYFLGVQELVSFSAFMGGVGIPTIAILGLVMIPFLDREETAVGRWLGGKDEPNIALRSTAFGLASVILLEAFAISFGWLRDWIPGLPQLIVTFINPGTVLVLLYALWSLGVVRKTGSTRQGAVALFTCFLAGFIVLTVIGVHFRGPNWDFYWSPSMWPTAH